MAAVQFYKNKYNYPKYSETITPVGNELSFTPETTGLKSGTVIAAGDMNKFMNCNYIRIRRDGATIYAWIDDVEFHTDSSFYVRYSVDPWRTFKNKIDLGIQFVTRQPQSTTKKDKLLGAATETNEVKSFLYSIGEPSKRIFVVQLRTDSGEIFSRTPVQPTPYQFYFIEYDTNNWSANTSLDSLMTILGGAKPINIVTMYSIPWCDISSLPSQPLNVERSEGDRVSVTGFRFLGSGINPATIFYNEAPLTSYPFELDQLKKVAHSVQLVISDGGIITIPDELLSRPNLRVRQDIDLFSGACNYMLKSDVTEQWTQSVRGSSISSIPIVSDPYDTYLSQNQNALTTSLIGDVANIAIGGAMAFGGGGLGAVAGSGAVMSGAKGLIDRFYTSGDIENKTSNPPAFLGTALASTMNGRFWMVITQTPATNHTEVNDRFGYPINMLKTLVFPTSGYIETEGCNVSSDGTVPRWAIEEINTIFNNGIRVY